MIIIALKIVFTKWIVKLLAKVNHQPVLPNGALKNHQQIFFGPFGFMFCYFYYFYCFYYYYTIVADGFIQEGINLI